MSLHFYSKKEDINKEESINNYQHFFSKYDDQTPTLSEALNQLFKSKNIDNIKIDELTEDILDKCKEKIKTTFDKIKKKYNNISENDAYIICSYTCESKEEEEEEEKEEDEEKGKKKEKESYSPYSPYRILNKNLISDNRKKGLENVSKYLYLLLNSLRKLPRYYPKKEEKYLYRCITHKVDWEKNYKKGNKKTFWAFTSTSVNPIYTFLKEENKENKSGTIFSLGGDIWGYDIELFNYYNEKEILLEPERKFIIDNVLPEVSGIINVTCIILKTPIVLNNNNLEKSDEEDDDDEETSENEINEINEKEINEDILELYEINDKIKDISKELKFYSKFTQEQFLKEIKRILSLNNPIYTSAQKKVNNYKNLKNLKSIEEIVGEYIFTPDNFVKIIQILQKIKENAPIIMIGETGCGKTELIMKLSELINNGESELKIMNFHSEITNEDIENFLFGKKALDYKDSESIIQKAEKLEAREENIRKLYEGKGRKYSKKKLWILLDKFNTGNCMDLIIELMIKHSCKGKKLPENIFLIGECNPYRFYKKEPKIFELKKDEIKENKLVYNVNSIPPSLDHLVINFGNLSPENEKKYIDNMVKNIIEKFFWKDIERKNRGKKEIKRKKIEKYLNEDEYALYEDLKNLSSIALIESQNYIRKINDDISSVSLREIRHFSNFYEFFVNCFRNN